MAEELKPLAWATIYSSHGKEDIVEIGDANPVQERMADSLGLQHRRVQLVEIPAGHVLVSEGLLRSALTHAHNRGYLAGHHDTVEAQFSHILSSELDSYRSEQVEDILQALLGEGKEHE
ncbi:hypothetical protein KUT99_05740 [Pseudomonas aeruginosa]|nr:hypothetical protein [Pseudomonas aeruginosa]MBV5930479.1 hypothetical protein [Pseudomonas aeruginosa]